MQPDSDQVTSPTRILTSTISAKTSRACHHDPEGDCGLCFPPPGVDFQLIHTGRHYRPGPPRENGDPTPCTHLLGILSNNRYYDMSGAIRLFCAVCNTPIGKHERAP